MNTHTEEILENYDLYKKFIIDEAELVFKEKKKYIQTNSINSITKVFTLDQMIDFFYLEGEKDIVNELSNIREAIVIKHFLKGQSLDI